MSYHSLGVIYDVKKDYTTAAYYYELAALEERTASAFIDLAALYFQFTDIGINADSQLPVDFIKTAFDRYDLIIERGIDAFPSNSEMLFWKAYFRHQTIYDDFTESDVLNIIGQGKPSLVPFFFLYILEPQKYEAERQELLRNCSSLLTSKNRWILSLIDTPAIDLSES